MSGNVGYLYAEQELNEICKIYGYGYGCVSNGGGAFNVGGPYDELKAGSIEETGARSLNIEDIKNLVTSEGGKDISEFENGITTSGLRYYPTVTGTMGSSSYSERRSVKGDGINYAFSDTGDFTRELFNDSCWIANRFILVTSATSSVSYGTLYCQGGGTNPKIRKAELVSGEEDGSSSKTNNKGIRPVVTLGPGVIDVLGIKKNVNGRNQWNLK